MMQYVELDKKKCAPFDVMQVRPWKKPTLTKKFFK